MSKPERQHIIDAFAYEVGHVKNKDVKQRVADMFSNVDLEMAKAFAIKIGVAPPVSGVSANETIAKSSPALSQENTPKSALSRKVAVVIADGFDYNQVKSVMNALQKGTDKGTGTSSGFLNGDRTRCLSLCPDEKLQIFLLVVGIGRQIRFVFLLL